MNKKHTGVTYIDTSIEFPGVFDYQTFIKYQTAVSRALRKCLARSGLLPMFKLRLKDRRYHTRDVDGITVCVYLYSFNFDAHTVDLTALTLRGVDICEMIDRTLVADFVYMENLAKSLEVAFITANTKAGAGRWYRNSRVKI